MHSLGTKRLISAILGYLCLTLTWLVPSQSQAFQGSAISALAKQCNELAERPNDPQKVTSGVAWSKIDEAKALPACREASEAEPDNGKIVYQYGRVLDHAGQKGKAIEVYEQAARLGYPMADLRLATIYYYGLLDQKRNYKLARDYLTTKAVQSHYYAQYLLGNMYSRGRGVQTNLETARQWFQASADQNYTGAFTPLGKMYFYGEGGPKDQERGLALVKKAAERGNKQGQEALKELQNVMSKQSRTAADSTANAQPNIGNGNSTEKATSALSSSGAIANNEGSGGFMDMLNMLAGASGLGVLIVALILLLFIGYFVPFRLWITAWASGAYVGLLTLVAMRLRRVPPHSIIKARISAVKAGLQIPLDELESHFLAGGNVVDVVNAIISADKANIELTFNRAAAIDLAGRNVLDAVQMSVLPKVIQTPRNAAVAQDGIQLIGVARVTVRANLDRLVGGAGEETVIARVGEGMVSAIGSALNHKDVLERPDSISKKILANGLDAGTAFEILSIDIADIDVGKNIGASLQIEQANADKQIAQAKAEERRAMAVAHEQEMRAKVVEAEAEVPRAMADAFKAGRIYGTPATA